MRLSKLARERAFRIRNRASGPGDQWHIETAKLLEELADLIDKMFNRLMICGGAAVAIIVIVLFF